MRSLLAIPILVGCGGTEAAATVELPVNTSATAMAPAATDLGYEVQLTRLRLAVTQIQFTVEGEMHTEVSARIGGSRPHPGHSAGGEVTGELPGNFILEWNGQPRPDLGVGTLIVGDYQGANFSIRAAGANDGLAAGDPLLGHAFHITGTVSKDGTTKDFDAVLDVEPDTQVVGAAFEDVVTEISEERLDIAFFATDPYENDTAFDGVDYFALPTSAANVIEIRPGSPAHNIIRRVIQTHDHYGVTPH